MDHGSSSSSSSLFLLVLVLRMRKSVAKKLAEMTVTQRKIGEEMVAEFQALSAVRFTNMIMNNFSKICLPFLGSRFSSFFTVLGEH